MLKILIFFQRFEAPDITMSQFKSHAFIYAADLTTAGAMVEDRLPLLKSGSLRLKLDFLTETTNGLNILIMGYFPAALTIDKERNVTVATLN